MRITLSRFILLYIFLVTGVFTQNGISAQDNIKILPLGNSITVGYTDGILPVEKQTSFRFGLYYQLLNAGYNFDFVGSEMSGWAYFTDCQHAGINGFRDQYMVRLLQDGYDLKRSVQLVNPPGPYLDVYDPDIILLHIGTNDITHETYPGTSNVEAVLNLIDEYEIRAGKEVPVFLALIINRMHGFSLRTETTYFNDQIRAMAEARIQNGDKIVIVDMENDAGLEYTSADMTDYLHPNSVGYNKMAMLWFNSIKSYFNQAPEIIPPIPDQEINEGDFFNSIHLDAHVTDAETPVEEISWSFIPQSPANLNININGSRQVSVTVKDEDWHGSQTIIFVAEDGGINGDYKRSDSDTVVFTVIPVNDPPEFTSIPITSAEEGTRYKYVAEATDVDSESLTYYSKKLPGWLNFNPDSRILSGTPGNDDVGEHQVIISVTDGSLDTDQIFTVTVENVNDVPLIVGMASSIKTSINIPVEVELEDLMVDDPDNVYPDDFSLSIEPGDNYTITANTVIPDQDYLGILVVPARVFDGNDFSPVSNVNVQVVLSTHSEVDEYSGESIQVYPNPSSGLVYVRMELSGEVRIEFINSLGATVFNRTYNNPMTEISIDLNSYGVRSGIYLYRIRYENTIKKGKILIQ